MRTTSRLLFSSRPVSRERFEEVKKDCDQGISLYNRAELADIQVLVGGREALSRLREKDHDLADFLQHLDAKLTALLKKVDPSPTLLDDLVLQSVNISGGGLAFWSREGATPGDIFEHYILLPPMKSFICCFCEITSCKEETDREGNRLYRISGQFCLIMEEDREALIQFNFQQQGRVLQRRRLGAGK